MNISSKVILIVSSTFFFGSCAGVKTVEQKELQAISLPPCNFQAGRLNIRWINASNANLLKLKTKNGNDSLPKHFTVFKINKQSLYSYLKHIKGLPYGQRVISMPINKGTGCMLFHLESSGTLSPELQKKFPNIQSFKGLSENAPNAQLRLDFDGKSIRAEVKRGEKIELMSPWSDEDGIVYYLLYKKEDARNQKKTFKPY